MLTELYEELDKIVQNLMDKEGITEYKWRIDGHTVPGENYMGEIIFFQILNKDGAKIQDLVMKTAKRSEELRNSLPLEHVYSREIFLYSRVFPEFRKFLVNVKADLELDFVPESRWISADQFKETLVFQNLKSDGYKLRDREIAWNLEHSLFAMEHYAKFHAISLAFQDQNPELFRELTRNLSDVTNEFCKMINVREFYGKPLKKIMKLLKTAGREDLITKYDGFVEKNFPILTGKIHENDRIVIIHGDCWNNNFMFKYKDKNEIAPWKMYFLDFQLASLGTPIKDLSYNIFTTCDKSCLQHLDLILETYYNTLSETVRKLGSNPDVLFSRETFKNHWEKYSKYGIILTTIVTKLSLTSSGDAPDLVKLAEEKKAVENTFDFDLKNEDEYNRRILDVFTFYGDRFL